MSHARRFHHVSNSEACDEHVEMVAQLGRGELHALENLVVSHMAGARRIYECQSASKIDP